MRLLTIYKTSVGFGITMRKNDDSAWKTGGYVCEAPNVQTSLRYWQSGFECWWAEKELARKIDLYLKSLGNSGLSVIAFREVVSTEYHGRRIYERVG